LVITKTLWLDWHLAFPAWNFNASGAVSFPGPAGCERSVPTVRRRYGWSGFQVERLKSGDWTGFGTELDAMRGLLEDMIRQAGGH
jgi:hypothetical protein